MITDCQFAANSDSDQICLTRNCKPTGLLCEPLCPLWLISDFVSTCLTLACRLRPHPRLATIPWKAIHADIANPYLAHNRSSRRSGACHHRPAPRRVHQCHVAGGRRPLYLCPGIPLLQQVRSEEHTSELQS